MLQKAWRIERFWKDRDLRFSPSPESLQHISHRRVIWNFLLRLFLKKIVFSPNVEISVSPYTLRNRSYPLNFSFLRIPSSNSLPHRDPMKYVNERIDGKVDFRKRYRSSRGRRDGGWFSAGGSGTTPGSGEQLRGKKLEPVSGKKFLICGIIKGDGAKSITDSTPLSENREFHLASTIPSHATPVWFYQPFPVVNSGGVLDNTVG